MRPNLHRAVRLIAAQKGIEIAPPEVDRIASYLHLLPTVDAVIEAVEQAFSEMQPPFVMGYGEAWA